VTCHNCTTDRIHTDTYGCCGGCGQAFIGITAFDMHFAGDGEERGCVDPATLIRRNGNPMLERVDVLGGQAWRKWQSSEQTTANKERLNDLRVGNDPQTLLQVLEAAQENTRGAFA
jgi:hypothetical protein